MKMEEMRTELLDMYAMNQHKYIFSLFLERDYIDTVNGGDMTKALELCVHLKDEHDRKTR